MRVGAVLEQEELGVRARAAPARRAAGRARPGCPGSSRPSRARRGSWPVTSSASTRAPPTVRDGGPGERAGEARRRRPPASSSPSPSRVPTPGASGSGSSVGDPADRLGQLAVARAPARPAGDRRPGGLRSPSSRRRARSGRRAGRARRPRPAARRGRSPGPPAAGAISSTSPTTVRTGQAMSARVTVRSSITNPPWSIRLWAMNWRMKSATAGPGPGDPALPHQEPPLALARQQRLAVVELADEVDPLAQRLDRVEQAEAGAAHPRRHRGAPEDPGERRRRRLGDLLGDPERQRDPGVDRAAEGDHRVDPLAAPVRGGLVTEHPALRVAAEVDVAARSPRAPGRPRRRPRRRGRRGCARGRPPRARGRRSRPPTDRRRLVQDGDGARGGRDVVDLGGEHHRRHEQDRRPGGRVRRSSGAAGRRGRSATTSNGDGSSPVSSPPKRATSKAFCAAAPSRDAGLRDRVWDQRDAAELKPVRQGACTVGGSERRSRATASTIPHATSAAETFRLVPSARRGHCEHRDVVRDLLGLVLAREPLEAPGGIARGVGERLLEARRARSRGPRRGARSGRRCRAGAGCRAGSASARRGTRPRRGRRAAARRSPPSSTTLPVRQAHQRRRMARAHVLRRAAGRARSGGGRPSSSGDGRTPSSAGRGARSPRPADGHRPPGRATPGARAHHRRRPDPAARDVADREPDVPSSSSDHLVPVPADLEPRRGGLVARGELDALDLGQRLRAAASAAGSPPPRARGGRASSCRSRARRGARGPRRARGRPRRSAAPTRRRPGVSAPRVRPRAVSGTIIAELRPSSRISAQVLLVAAAARPAARRGSPGRAPSRRCGSRSGPRSSAPGSTG